MTIVLADDHELVRAGIRMVLEDEPGFEVVAEAGDAEAAARYVLGHKPSILVLDLSMPGTAEPRGAPEGASRRRRTTSVVVLTMQNEPAFARKALQGGAKGYVIKQSAASELVDRDPRGGRAAGPTSIPSSARGSPPSPTSPEGPPDELTPREVEVLGLLALGYVNPEIAEKLVLSVRTVETHRANIQRKTGLSTRAELIAYAIDNELVER